MAPRMEKGAGVAAPTPNVDPFCGSGGFAKAAESDSNTVHSDPVLSVLSAAPNERADYMRKLSNMLDYLDEIQPELGVMWNELEDMRYSVAHTDNLRDGDREKLLSAIDAATDATASLCNGCYDDAYGAIQWVMGLLK